MAHELANGEFDSTYLQRLHWRLFRMLANGRVRFVLPISQKAARDGHALSVQLTIGFIVALDATILLPSAACFGAGDRNRTGKPVRATDFRHTAFLNARPGPVCALDYAFTIALGCRCPPSSLYTFPRKGLARRCLGAGARGFSEFEGIHAGAFACPVLNLISPLCLPISPPRHGVTTLHERSASTIAFRRHAKTARAWRRSIFLPRKSDTMRAVEAWPSGLRHRS